MNNKIKNISRWLPLAIGAYIIVMSASFKLCGSQQLIGHYTQLHLLQYMSVLGIMELTFIALFLYPQTMKIGFLLITAYFGGAIATELSNGNSIIFPTAILTLVWIAAWLRKPSLFINNQNQNQHRHYSMNVLDADQQQIECEDYI